MYVVIAALAAIATRLGGAPWYYSLLAGLATLLVFLAIVIIWQSYRRERSVGATDESAILKQAEAIREHTRELQRQRSQEEANKIFKRFRDSQQQVSPLKIEFSDEWSCSEFIQEQATIGSDMVSRRVFWTIVRNDSSRDVRNVRAQIGDIREWTILGEGAQHTGIGQKTFPLQFHGGMRVFDFSPQMVERLPLVSYAAQPMASFIRIEGENTPVRHDDKAWRFTVTITADGLLPVKRNFLASVNGLLEVKALE